MADGLETGQYAIGEKVLVPHTDKFYEAKILKAEFREDKLWYYFLHYTGWNKKYDEWVEETGLAKCPTGDNAALANSRKRVTLKEKFQRKRNVMDISMQEGPGVHLDLDIPAILKKQLLDDYDAVVEDAKLVPLPRSPTVAELLQRYCTQAHEQRGSSENEQQVALGLVTYFDKSLEAVLLYRAERAQAQEALADGRAASCVYGAEHLCRLLIKLPELLGVANATEDQRTNIAAMVQDVMYWMADNAITLFVPKDMYLDTGAAPAY
mmetsp:Transcript_13654/g.29289  ORF Transcript_13654/g.29289 Transcript_13654/m.29289 type:complete len:266 (+) Transcript_13654:201-998(+)|eukprot:CAMPEP_0202904334 /NCGR_PEP_ID=MMETSP1392-20130828/28873_1 /ASSEMBLY_ACC=CAM_ASM_000868 /TAXON_ID=225041 /ORGANISM="Chlamydomonas chlamydogama, Strain SAG 11-48b" /LENGTH=265 /DNA_ID=CAMNT_0049591905 /DNA_START=157 /DNA_END=954 /DNA_ORIENTATION=-